MPPHRRLDRQQILQDPPFRLAQIAPAQSCLQKEALFNRSIQRQPIRPRRLVHPVLTIYIAIHNDSRSLPLPLTATRDTSCRRASSHSRPPCRAPTVTKLLPTRLRGMPMERIGSLDSLRGLAALVVVLYHFSLVLPRVYHPRLESIWPLRIVLAGERRCCFSSC